MKISLNWLNTYLDKPIGADELEDRLTNLGFPIDERRVIDATGNGGEADEMLDVEVTNNRGDCLSHVNLAREVAAATGWALRAPDCGLPEAGDDTGIDEIVTVEQCAGNLCRLYTARVIRGVRIGPSPDWLVRRLEAIGLRSVNNVVDVTNFVMMELGHPLHAFDLNLLSGKKIVIRSANKGEPFGAIDGSRHELGPGTLVIADAEKPVAVAGVMGGQDSEVRPETTDLLIEAAVFDPLTVRHAARRMKLASDSSYRFERGVDPAGVDAASRRAAKLIMELAGGQLANGVIRVGPELPPPREVALRVDRCNRLLGLDLTAEQTSELLARLSFSPKAGADANQIVCTIPTYRLDLTREVDLIEEVARLHGYDGIGVTEKIHITAKPLEAPVAALQELRGALTSLGYYETITFTFVRTTQGEPFVPPGHLAVTIEDDRRKAEPMLRPSLLPSLLACRHANQSAGNRGVRLFETAATWSRKDGALIERNLLTLIRDADEPQQDLRAMRGAIEQAIDRMRGPGRVEVSPIDAPGYDAAASVRLGDTDLGRFGLLDAATTKLFNLHTPVIAAEIDLDTLTRGYPPQRPVSPLARFPGIERDLSIVVAESVRWSQVERAVNETRPEGLDRIDFIGVYRGKPIATGSKSVSFRLLFRDTAGTLRHEQVDPQVNQVVDRLKAELSAELRA